MTDDPQKEATTEFADSTAADAASGADVTVAVDDAQHSAEHLRRVLEAQRDGVVQLNSTLQDASSLTSATEGLLAEFTRTAEALAAERHQLERQKAAFIARELAVSQAEELRDQDFAEERASVERAFSKRRAEALADLDTELTLLRSTRLADLTAAETAERDRIRAQIAKERADWDEALGQQQRGLKQQRDELEKQKGAVSALQSELEGRRVTLDNDELDLEGRSDSLKRQVQKRRDNLDEDIATLVVEERKSFESSLLATAEDAARLRATIQSQTALLGAFDHLQQQLGGREPGAVILELNSKSDEIKRLIEDLATRPTEEVRTRLNTIESENRTLNNQIDQLTSQVAQNQALASQSNDLKLKNTNLEATNKSLEQKAKIFEAAANEAESELNRLRSAYERPAEIEARYKEIELPAIRATDVTPPRAELVDETEWLNGIAKASDDYGLHFNSRILKAFHTSLKTAEWSPLTVLAGVSGTGKSELPRLYSHFGGLFYQSLAVQPNWDSQESMLGFFNSIDNRFDAQPALRFLAQSQKPWEDKTEASLGYPGLEDAVCLILLDEMNLAHPELYFAEFLSKLELRRGNKGADVPVLPVKIGAGMEPYQLKLGRNVLWTGTMNQDETTKSLSDKVIDRSMIIHFPRPTELQRRLKLTPLDARNRGTTLHKNAWDSWKVLGSPFTDAEVKPFKEFVEMMNTHLEVAGRAIGHRVWQSVEYYMANYPDVRAAGEDSAKKAQAMHIAFEDQLVQKVMPKMRGIDTRGKSKDECLDKIRGQLITGIGGNGFNLAEDFDLATELGYGQFIWQSANYLRVEASDES